MVQLRQVFLKRSLLIKGMWFYIHLQNRYVAVSL